MAPGAVWDYPSKGRGLNIDSQQYLTTQLSLFRNLPLYIGAVNDDWRPYTFENSMDIRHCFHSSGSFTTWRESSPFHTRGKCLRFREQRTGEYRKYRQRSAFGQRHSSVKSSFDESSQTIYCMRIPTAERRRIHRVRSRKTEGRDVTVTETSPHRIHERPD